MPAHIICYRDALCECGLARLSISSTLLSERQWRRTLKQKTNKNYYFGLLHIEFADATKLTSSCLHYQHIESKCELALVLEAHGLAHCSPITHILYWDESIPDSIAITAATPW
jgi:hypothetical protein